MANKWHNLERRTLRKDQLAASLTLHILETLGVIRQLLILLRNYVAVAQIKDEQINMLD
jgi:hypothetical protein